MDILNVNIKLLILLQIAQVAGQEIHSMNKRHVSN